MQYVRPPISTWCVGQACSMASLLLAAGAPDMRHSLPNSRIMVHQPSGGVQVNDHKKIQFCSICFQCVICVIYLPVLLLYICVILIEYIVFSSG